jgi:hypothetical protein
LQREDLCPLQLKLPNIAGAFNPSRTSQLC